MHGKMVRSALSSFLPSPKPPAPQSQSKKRRSGEEEEGLLIPGTAATSQDLLPSTLYLRPAQKFKSSLLSRSRFHPSFPSLINSTNERSVFAPIHAPFSKKQCARSCLHMCTICFAKFSLHLAERFGSISGPWSDPPTPTKRGNGSA